MPRKPNKRHSITQPLDESYRYIALTRNQTTTVDAEDLEWLSKWNWHAVWNSYTKSFYAYRKEKNKSIAMHREIIGCAKDKEVDHRDHNTLDNRRKNLREATRFQNMFNKSSKRNNRSGFKGVIKRSETLWRCVITSKSRRFHIGYFSTAEEAALAYDIAARKHHGEFAYQNF